MANGQNDAYPPSPFPTCIGCSDAARAAADEKAWTALAYSGGPLTTSRRPFGDQTGEVFGSNPNDVYDADVREDARGGPFVDGGGADAEELGDLAHREELLDRRQQIGSKISVNRDESLRSLDGREGC